MADEFDLKPTSRAEEFLDVILRSLGGDTPDIPQPAWRYEEYLAAIANAIQNGGGGSSGGGVLVVHQDGNGVLDKTWKEIAESDLCILNDGSAKLMQYSISVSPGKFKVRFWDFSESSQVIYMADTETGYPVYAGT